MVTGSGTSSIMHQSQRHESDNRIRLYQLIHVEPYSSVMKQPKKIIALNEEGMNFLFKRRENIVSSYMLTYHIYSHRSKPNT